VYIDGSATFLSKRRPSNSEISSIRQANAFSSSGKKSLGETKNKNVPNFQAKAQSTYEIGLLL
jgi:hypothetical protein